MGSVITQDKSYSYTKADFKQANKEALSENFLQGVIQHEGLEPYQTPFRITSEAMRNWKTIHGYKINKEIVPSKGRENFIYLLNQEDLFPAVRQQFMNYATNPKKYGLPQNPTVEQAVKVFDQTGAQGKLNFLKKMGIDSTVLLEELF
jgi:hypothetical protein